MVKRKKELRIVAPVGDVPSTDKELHKKIRSLRSVELSKVFRAVGDWEKTAIIRSKQKEQTKKSGKLTIQCR